MAVTSTGLGARKSRRALRGRIGRSSPTAPAVPLICPYLIAEDGAWRSARPSRDHRCGAVEPAAPLAIDKQRRLCLVRAHGSCATRAAAVAQSPHGHDEHDGAAADHAPRPVGATRWSIVRTAPVVLDSSGGGRGVPRGRQLGQWALAGLMALALAAVILARLPEAEPADAPAVLAATGAPSRAALAASADPTRRSSPTGTATPAAATRDRATPPAVTAKPAAPTPATYVVGAGDTLIGIARAHETTVAALQEANGLGTSTVIKVGQELVLPSAGTPGSTTSRSRPP